MSPESGQEAEQSPSKEIADLLSSRYGEEHGFDPETCEEIAAMPFEEAFETAYGYLAQAGVDPDEALSDFTEEPTEE
jgi:hypothetical protein